MVLIPSEAGLLLRQPGDISLQPVPRVPGLPGDLPDLQPGQMFSASIQEALPENTYRALVAGKNVTLSLTESVKAGDLLELVVVDRTPKTIVARLAEQPAAEPGAAEAYPYANLSRAAQFIATLLVPEGESPPAAPLNGGEPLLATAPQSGDQLVPALARAVTESGLFYEAHQAQWVAGKLPLSALLAEPQGQHSPNPTASGEPPGAAAMPPEAAAMPPQAVTMPPQAVTMPPQAVTMPPQAVTMPPQAAAMPPEAAAMPPEAAAMPPQTPQGESTPPSFAPAPQPEPAPSPAADLLGGQATPLPSAQAEPAPASSMHVSPDGPPPPPSMPVSPEQPGRPPAGTAPGQPMPSPQEAAGMPQASSPPASMQNVPTMHPLQVAVYEGVEAATRPDTQVGNAAPAGSTARAGSTAQAANTAQSGHQAQAAQTAATTAHHQAAPTVPTDLRPLVQQQLNAAATQTLVWQGEVWPGQTMHWQIEREPPDRHQGTEAEARWSTTLSLNTPRLGNIKAALSLSGQGVAINLATLSEQSAADLRTAAPALARALAAAGVNLLGITARHESG